uniref:Uncharacterized protein n=1 Tax=Chenopodium quinoa TaxID=63459 RepID=A0A803MZK7_CHEQI
MGTVAIDAAQLASEHQSANRRGQRMKATMKRHDFTTAGIRLVPCRQNIIEVFSDHRVMFKIIIVCCLLFAACWSAVLPAVCCCGCAAVFSAALLTSCCMFVLLLHYCAVALLVLTARAGSGAGCLAVV